MTAPADEVAKDDELVLVATEAMRARRAPLAIVWMWAFQAAAAALAAWPAWNVVRGAYGGHPLGDAPLWKPGGVALLDLVVAWQGRTGPLAPTVLLAAAAAAVLGVVPLALVLGQMAYATRARGTAPFARLAPRALAAFGPLVAALAAARIAELVIAGVALGAGRGVASAAVARLGEARAQQLGAAVGLAILALAVGVTIVHDLASAAIVRFGVPATRAVRIAASTLRRAPVALVSAWGWRAAGMAALVISSSVIVERLGERAAEAPSLLLVLALHQLVVFARLTLRASWLGRALRAVDLAYRVVRRRDA